MGHQEFSAGAHTGFSLPKSTAVWVQDNQMSARLQIILSPSSGDNLARIILKS